jgi:signal transduction histidine kinase
MKFDPGIVPSLRLDDTEKPEAPPPPFITCLNLAANHPADFVRVWQQVVDNLTEQVALLDEDWTILVANKAWAKIVALDGHFAQPLGTNYLEPIRQKAAAGDPPSRLALAGIEEIISGNRSSFKMIYRGTEYWEGRDIQVSIHRFEIDGHKFASVTRYDVSKLLELRKLREDFSGSVIREQAEERRRMGREIHDSTMQLLAALGLMIGQLKRSCDTRECAPILEEMDQLLTEAQQEIRSISYLAHPPLLGKMSLTEALRALVEGFGRRTGLNVEFELAGRPRPRSLSAEGALYRVVQEALSNVHRHSKATHATVRLSGNKAMTHLVIADDGIGMPDVIRAGVGLSGMRSRLSELGGRLFIRPRSPGTAVIASVPAERRTSLGSDVLLHSLA